LEGFPESSWVTIGDGRCASDARYIRSCGRSVLATDIAPQLLRVAKERGAIDDYRAENAESLSFVDEQFDFALCKEAYHHFPRPMIALYEMLRVARVGVVLIEPYDRFARSLAPEWTWNGIKRLGRRITGRQRAEARFHYEDTG